MPTFYFTYGTDPAYPFEGGWTTVIAPDRLAATALFRIYHPDRVKGIVNCADIYDERSFKMLDMFTRGNFKKFCREVIMVGRVVEDDEQ